MIDRSRISILTICRNNLAGLKRTLDSVLQQDDAPDEVIVVDGASTDGTVEFLKTVQGIKWSSEPDNGISDAFNKALQNASGEWVLFLNSGDCLSNTAIIRKVRSKLSSLSSDIGVLCGNAQYYDQNHKRMLEIHSNPDVLAKYCAIAHQATFVRRDLHSQHLFNQQLNNGMDYDLWLRLRGVTDFESIDLIVSLCEWGGVSTDPRSAVHAILLEEAIRWVNFSKTRNLTLKNAFHVFLRSLYVSIKFALLRK